MFSSKFKDHIEMFMKSTITKIMKAMHNMGSVIVSSTKWITTNSWQEASKNAYKANTFKFPLNFFSFIYFAW